MSVKHLGLVALLLAASSGAGAFAGEDGEGDGGGRDVGQSVVKISATRRDPNLFHPWIKQDAEQTGGTGVVIAGRRILTNAHVVKHSSQVFIQPPRGGDKVAATVRAIAPGIDLAVLTVDDGEDAFFATHPPLPLRAKLPAIKDTIHVYGFPTGGEQISITKGVVSRIEYADYYYEMMGLRIQVDAAINPGNSGGPAVVGDEMVGIVFSRLQEADNIGYIIPAEEIELFLADVADGAYDGKPILFDVFQRLQNGALRKRLKLGPDVSGVLVERPDRDDPGYPLKRWDVIRRIGGRPLDNSGMVADDRGLRLQFTYYVQKLARDGTVPLDVRRDGEDVHVDLPVDPYMRRPRLLDYLENRYPSYLVWGPLVFTAVTLDLVHDFESAGTAEKWFPFYLYERSPLLARSYDRPRFAGEQLVMAVAMFPHKLTDGYDDPNYPILDEVNGVKVRNLRHLAELLRDARDEFVVFRFHDRRADVLTFEREKVRKAADEILTDNGVRTPYSADLRDVLEPAR